MITFFSSADTAWTLGAPWMLSVSMEYKNNRYLLPNMTGVFACDDERRVRSGSGVQSQPHRHPAHVAAQLLQATATFLRPLGGLHRLRLPQLRLPLDVRRNRCHLVVRPAKRMMVRILCRNSRVQCLCLYCTFGINWTQNVLALHAHLDGDVQCSVSWCSLIHVIWLPGIDLTWGMYVYL